MTLHRVLTLAMWMSSGICVASCSDSDASASTAPDGGTGSRGTARDAGSQRALLDAASSTSMRTETAVDASPPAKTTQPHDAGKLADAAPSQRVADAEPSSEADDDAGPPASDKPLIENAADARDSSLQLVKRMAPGWNLGNSLDSCSMVATDQVDETTWGNPRVKESLFLALKRYGIRSVRIPVTWRHHLGPAPDYTIDPAFLRRVQEVVDYAVKNDLYAIINLHHDGGGDPEGGAWIRKASTDYDATAAKFVAIWTQIAARFQDYPHRLLFEAMNEVGFDDLEKAEAYKRLNMLNQAFVDTVRGSAGNNPTRHVLFSGYWTDFAESSMGTVVPNDPASRSILSVHYYTPWMFCVTADVQTWGTDDELSELRSKFDLLKTFTERKVPVILGEYAVNPKAERPSRLYWLEHTTKAAFDMGIAPIFWDNGEELDRTTYEWRTPGLLDALQRATSGKDYEIKKP